MRDAQDAELATARRAAQRAAERGGYMASLLQEYRVRQHMSDEELAAYLRCPIERLPLLGLCGQPRADTFAPDVRTIAAFARADSGRLAQLIRAVAIDETLATRVRDPAIGYAAAARDREDEPDVPLAHSDATDESPEANGDVG